MEEIHPIINPKEIIVMGINFIWVGRNVIVEEIGLIQVNVAPIVTAIRARSNIGMVIGNSSLIEIIGEEFEVVHIVTIENRVE